MSGASLTPVLPGSDDCALKSSSVVDASVLQEIVGGDPAVVDEFLADYLAVATRQAGELREAFEIRDCERLGRSAHKLKSSSRSIGANVLADICSNLEVQCRSQDEAAIRSYMSQFDAALALVEREITRLLSRQADCSQRAPE